MIREILTYPNKKLKSVSKDVTLFDEKLHELLSDMNETMQVKNGIGLAAVQVGVALNTLIVNPCNEEGEQFPENLIEVINPKIVKKSGEIKYKEGCLSLPEFYEEVTRFEHVTVEFFDRFGNKTGVDAEGLLSICLQHEMDHLSGKLFFERLSILKRKKFEKEYLPTIKPKRASKATN